MESLHTGNTPYRWVIANQVEIKHALCLELKSEVRPKVAVFALPWGESAACLPLLQQKTGVASCCWWPVPPAAAARNLQNLLWRWSQFLLLEEALPES